MITKSPLITSGKLKNTPYVKLPCPEHFDINKIFDCGQCFRFEKCDDFSFCGVAYGKYIKITQKDGFITIFGSTEDDFNNIWYHYLALDEDYDEINDDIIKNMNHDKTISKAILCGDGIRILNQEPWETLCSFIISQNNNIPRIKKIISSLCSAYGEKITTDDGIFYSFPSPEVLLEAGESAIFALKTGFRAKYIIDAAKKFPSLPIEEMLNGKMSYEQCDRALREIKGVGAKVSSCVLLFTFGKKSAFPIDVWVKRVLEKYYTPSFNPDTIGEFAGVAQQYLFYYERYGYSK